MRGDNAKDMVGLHGRLGERIRKLETGAHPTPVVPGGFGKSVGWAPLTALNDHAYEADTHVERRVKSDVVWLRTVGPGGVLIGDEADPLWSLGPSSRPPSPVSFLMPTRNVETVIIEDPPDEGFPGSYSNDFSAALEAEWVKTDGNPATMSGQLRMLAGGGFGGQMFLPTIRAVGDCKIRIKVIPQTTDWQYVGVGFRATDSTQVNQILAGTGQESPAYVIISRWTDDFGHSDTEWLAEGSTAMPAGTSPFWLELQRSGTSFVASIYTSEPPGTPYTTTSLNRSGTDLGTMDLSPFIFSQDFSFSAGAHFLDDLVMEGEGTEGGGGGGEPTEEIVTTWGVAHLEALESGLVYVRDLDPEDITTLVPNGRAFSLG